MVAIVAAEEAAAATAAASAVVVVEKEEEEEEEGGEGSPVAWLRFSCYLTRGLATARASWTCFRSTAPWPCGLVPQRGHPLSLGPCGGPRRWTALSLRRARAFSGK